LADWVGQTSALLCPLVDSLARHVMDGVKIHADDTPVSVLDPGRGRTKIARLWAYVRDDRPAAGLAPPAVWFQYTPDRKGEHPARHLRTFHGILQADGYAGFNALYEPTREAGVILEAACWAHVRRKFYEIHEDQKRLPGTLAEQALLRIAQLYAVEAPIRGRPADERVSVRQAHSRALVDELHAWLQDALAQVSAKSALAKAIGYAVTRWTALTRYLDDGRIEMDNNAAERAIRGFALGRKNWLFAGSNVGGERAAAVYSLIETAKLGGVNPQAYLTEVIRRIAHHPVNRVDELLPWNLAQEMAAARAPEQKAA
ncbi:MAG: IS66 family transposase, partial [Pseudohongiella sp.]|nr:IS66 family transposase [Pseudohongiella sp.]